MLRWLTGNNETPEERLRRGSREGDVAAVRALLRKGRVDVDARDETFHESALHVASSAGHWQLVGLLLEFNADPEAVDKFRETPLHKASAKGHFEVVQRLLKTKADPDAVDKEGWTALHCVSYKGHVQVLEILLKTTADRNVQDKDGWTPLRLASFSGHFQVVSLLLDAKADPNAAAEDEETPLHVASCQGQCEVVKLLLKAKANPNAANKLGQSPLYEASARNHVAVVELLLAANANPNLAEDTLGETPLHIASSRGQLQVVELLLKAGASHNAANKDGQTPLHIACETHQLEVARTLLASGADFNAKNNDRYNPLQVCLQSSGSRHSILMMLQLLVSSGVTWDPKCDNMVNSGRSHGDGLLFRLCVLLWIKECADCNPPQEFQIKLTTIPDEVLDRGVDSAKAFIDAHTKSRRLVLRRRVCVVGSNSTGKTNLIKSITSEEPPPIKRSDDDRTIGIDHFVLRFDKPVAGSYEVHAHEITFWDFAGHEAYQVAHSLFFSRRTLFLVCVDLDAFAIAYMKAVIIADEEIQETKLIDEFIDRAVMRWVRMIRTHQSTAELVFIATKEDLLQHNRVTEQLLKKTLMSKLEAVGATIQEMGGKSPPGQQTAVPIPVVDSRTPTHVGEDTARATVVFASCASRVSVRAVRDRIKTLIVGSEHSLEIPDSYAQALQNIVELREAVKTGEITFRISCVFAPVSSLPRVLKIEPKLCDTILRTLHDVGDVLWFEDLRIAFFLKSVILDPLLLIDFIRQIVNHKHSGLTMPHSDLKSKPFWIGLWNETHMGAIKQVLQKFHLVYTIGEDIMEWDSDLIVPAFWQTKMPASWLFLGDLLRIDSTWSRDAKVLRFDWVSLFFRVNERKSCDGEAGRVHWEYHFESGLPLLLFDHVVIASVSPYFKFEAGPDWIVYEEMGVSACRIMVDRDPKSLHQTIRIEAVIAKSATKKQVGKLWGMFKHLCCAFMRVLRRQRSLTVSSFAWDDAHNKVRLKDLVRARVLEQSVKWMPPARTWKLLRKHWPNR